MSNPTRAQGTKFHWGPAGVVAKLHNIGDVEVEADEMEVTNHDSQGKEFIAGLTDAGEVELEGYLTGDISQTALYADMQAGTQRAWKIVLPAAIGMEWGGEGFIKTFGTTGKEVDGVVGFKATLRISGLPALGTTAPPPTTP